MKNTGKKALLFATAAILVTSVATPAHAAVAPKNETPWATNINAAAQSKVYHKTIKDLQIHKGELYSGYGDYSDNIGPIAVNSHNLQTGRQTSHISSPNEEINVLRKFNDAVYAPYVDPTAPWTSNVGYSTNEGGTWQNKDVTPFIHVFDVASTGDDIWLAGSIANPDKEKYGPDNQIAAIKRSTDGGETWTIEKTRSSLKGGEWDRYYWLASVNGKIYAKAETETSKSTLDVWENGVWTEEETDMTISVMEASRVEVIGDTIVATAPFGSWSYNTETKQEAQIQENFSDFFYDEKTDRLYSLSKDGESLVDSPYEIPLQVVKYTEDGFNWKPIMNLDSKIIPASQPFITDGDNQFYNGRATSLAVDGNTFYFGTNIGTIYKKTIDQGHATVYFPTNELTLSTLATPLNDITAVGAQGEDLKKQVKTTRKVDYKGMTVTYKLTYNNQKFEHVRKVNLNASDTSVEL